MTQTLRRQRIQKFREIICNSEIYMQCRLEVDALGDELGMLVAALADAAESRTEKLTPEDYAAVDKKMDAILKQEAEAQSRIDSGTGWRGRELLAPEHLVYGDWWHAKTGLHMYGAKAKAKLDTGWAKAFKELYENDVTIAALNEAYTANEWRTVSSPAQIVSDAKAIQAAPVKVENKITLEDAGWN